MYFLTFNIKLNFNLKKKCSTFFLTLDITLKLAQKCFIEELFIDSLKLFEV